MDLKFEDESNDSDESNPIDVVGFERDFAEDCEPGSDRGYVLLTNGMSNRRMNVPPSFTLPIDPEGASLSYISYALHTNPPLGRAFRRVYRRICIRATRNADD